MSKFFKALEQAERDRQLREREERGAPDSPDSPAPALEGGPEARTAPAPVRESAPDPVPTPAARPVSPSQGMDEHVVSMLAPSTAYAEQYRTLRNVIEARAIDSGGYAVAISSPAKGDGKTLTALNLAGALAQSEASRVLLIDADLRAPAADRRIGLSAARGLVDAILDRSIELADVALTPLQANLAIVPAGRSLRSPYELLSSPRFGELLEQARRAYHYIIVDTPPLIPIPDCRLIGQHVDGLVIVVSAHRTPRRLVEEALRDLPPEKVLGFVFNNADQPFPGYYYYYGSDSSPSNGHGPGDSWVKRWIRRIKQD